MQYSRSIVSIALATFVFAGIAQAHPQATSGQDESGVPAYSDLSKDGKPLRRGDIPKDVAALQELRAHFREADKDSNGSLDKGEYDAYVHKSDAQQQHR